MSDFVLSPYWLGVLGSFTVAILFSVLLFVVLKPKISFSKEIAVFHKDGRVWYQFKFINESIFEAYDLSLELLSIEEYDATSTNEGVNTIAEDIKLTNHSWFFVPRKKLVNKNTRYAPHCVTVRVKDTDISQILKSNKHLELRIVLKHGFSNLTALKIQKYKSLRCLVDGRFEFGNTFKIS